MECGSVVRSAKVCTSCLSNLMQILAALLNMSALGSLFTEDKFESQSIDLYKIDGILLPIIKIIENLFI